MYQVVLNKLVILTEINLFCLCRASKRSEGCLPVLSVSSRLSQKVNVHSAVEDEPSLSISHV